MKSVYYFGKNNSDGQADMKNLLGGKGANLAEMAKLGIPVPAGLTITTDVCTYYYNNDQIFPNNLEEELKEALQKVESDMGKKFGDLNDPLLLSARSGARMSMPGMMETVLNVGLTSKTIPGIIKKTNNPRFVYDANRRLITMYSDVVMEKSEGIESAQGTGIREQLEEIMDHMKNDRGISVDTDLTADDLKQLCEEFKLKIKDTLGSEFPDDPAIQLWGGISAVFKSWAGKRASIWLRSLAI